MADSCYEESDEGESSEYESYSDLDAMEVESDLGKPVDLTVFEDQDVGQSSTKIPHEESTPLADEEAMPSASKEGTPLEDEDHVPLVKPYTGQLFENLQEAKAFYQDYGRKWGFGVRTRDSRREKARDNMVTRVVLSCDREGWHVKKIKPLEDPEKPVATRNTSTQRCGCPAMFRVVVRKDGRWVVNEFHETHNHNPVTPSKQMCMRGRRHMPKAAKALVESFREINLPVGKVVTLLDGKSVGFDERDCYNHLSRSKQYKTPVEGDASAMASFLCKKQTEDPQFFYAILTDKDSRAVNFLWIDGRSRSQYQHFGDVLYFDTTYKKNVYKMPFAPFTGVNHHLQSIQFGCALLLDETEESFVWAFETWLTAMGGQAPKAMITDQDPAMSKAVARVFPDTRHRYCLWHILKKFPEKLNHVYKKKSKFKKQIKWCIRGFYRVTDFERRWNELMIKYELTGNDWLKKLYDIREKWIPVYHLDIFYAGMNTTGRSEGMNSFYKQFFSRHTTLRDFALKNELCLQRMVEREKKEDYISEHKGRVVDGASYLLQSAAKLYTREVVSKLFQSMNIPCGHLIKVFHSRDIDEIPKYFVAKRWLQGANEYRAKYDGGVVSGHQNSKVLRSTHLAKMANALVYDAAEEDVYYTFMAQKFLEISEQYDAHKKVILKSKTFSSVDSNNMDDVIVVDTQAPPTDGSQAPVDGGQAPPTLDSEAPMGGAQALVDGGHAPPTNDIQCPLKVGNPRMSKPKGRDKESEKEKDDHTSASARYKYGLEKNTRKREYKQRECTLCKANGRPALGHNMRTCILNPNRAK